MKRMLSVFATILFLPLFVILQSCLVATQDTIITPQIQTIFKGTFQVDPYMETHIPLSVAVLPFDDRSQTKQGTAAVRKGFYNHFSSLPFKDMELHRVDRLLREAGLSDPEAIKKTSPQDLGRILNVEAVIFGDISDFDKLFAVVYSQVSVGAEIKMFDTKTGHFLWSGKHVARIHEGGLATNPVGLIATVVATAMNIRDIQLLRACDDLFRDMVRTIPVPSLADTLRPPVISLLTQDSKNLPKKAGDEIKIVIQGTPKMQAHFRIGDYKTWIPMQELEPGGYLGVYTVRPGDQLKNAMVTGYLTDDAGNTAEAVDAIGTISFDTEPPQKTKNLTAVGRNGLIILHWEKSAAPDLAGYRIYRSLTPLSGFQEISRLEFNTYRDQDLTNLQTYYYQVTAVDQAGNESEATETVAGMPIAPGPTRVSGSIESDTTWYAGAGPYIMEDTVTVRDKALLKIEPGTDIRSTGGALIIEGRLDARGDGDHLITFDAAADAKTWAGILFMNVKDRENIMRFCRIRNAATGVVCLNASPQVASCEFTENETAVKVTGAFSKPGITANTIYKNRSATMIIVAGSQPAIKGNRIMDNAREGVFIDGAAPSLTHNLITANQGGGISIRKSQAIVVENNIIDNKPYDMIADLTGDPVHALNNWWGSAKGLDILGRIKGKININAVLDAPWPDGRPVALPILDQILKGSITTDGYLTLSNSPYRVINDVVIDGGATLHIEPGVVILYDPNTSMITEDGGIIARGTKDSPITFTASAALPSPGSYTHAVRLAKPTKVNSAFVYCIVKYATTAFDLFYGSPEITSCHIAHNAQSGVYCRNDAAPRIFYNTFSGNLGEGGIRCVGASNPSIHNNNFIDNTVAIQTVSTIHIDARQNWWGQAPPDMSQIWGDNINIMPWLEKPEEKAFTAEKQPGEK